MRRNTLAYIFLVLFILIGVFVYLVIEENIRIEQSIEVDRQKFEVNKVRGNTILSEYKDEINNINEGKLNIIIKDRKDRPIIYDSYEELEHIVYLTQLYNEKIENVLGVEYRYYTLDDYSNLLNILKNSDLEIDEKKLRYYYGDEEISILKEKNEFNSSINSSSQVVENKDNNVKLLNANEIYGKDLIMNFNSHKNDIENGIKYFNVITNGISKNYKNINELKINIKENDIYKKEFEVNSNGVLKGYTFTKVDK